MAKDYHEKANIGALGFSKEPGQYRNKTTGELGYVFDFQNNGVLGGKALRVDIAFAPFPMITTETPDRCSQNDQIRIEQGDLVETALIAYLKKYHLKGADAPARGETLMHVLRRLPAPPPSRIRI